MIEQTLIDLTAAVNRLADAYERFIPTADRIVEATEAVAPPKKTRGKKAAPVETVTEEEQPTETVTETTEVVTEQELAAEVVAEPAAPEPAAEPESPSVGAVPAPTHSEIKQHIKDYRRLQAHMLAARKINHQTMLRETLDKLGLDNIDACPDDRLPELWAAVQEITQEIE